MEYCIDFKLKSKVLNKVKELNIIFNNSKILDLLAFLKEYNQYRINIELKNIDDITFNKIINILKEDEYKDLNIAFKFNEYKEEYIKKLKEIEIKFFFSTIIGNWDILHGYFNLGVSDVYVGKSLGFELDKVSKLARQKNIRIRVYPNICQSDWPETETLKTFFIRPEDIDIYGEYVDVIEFYGKSDRQDILYQIYAEEKQWAGNLEGLILNFNTNLNNRLVLPIFGEHRVKCEKKCLKDNKCKICERILQLSETLEKSKKKIQKTEGEKNNG